MVRHRILVTPRSLTEHPHPAIESLRERGIHVIYSSPGRQPDEEELLKYAPYLTGWLAGVEPISTKVIDAAPHLKVISRNGTGIDNLPLAYLKERGVAVRKADGANARGVAELALAMLFAALRHVPSTDSGLKQGHWPRKRGAEIQGRTLGVIGCGAVGGELARMAAALGVHVLGFDPALPDLGIPPGQFSWASHEDIFRRSDMISLHCPPLAGGKPLFSSETFELIKPGLIIVNTARAGLVDPVAVLEALDNGMLGTYCVDVFETEPPAYPGIASHPGVIATSHIGGYTQESVDRATEMAITNLLEELGV